MTWEITPACADVEIENRETADIVVRPRRKKVAFVGFASNTIHMVPWDDPEFEIWGMNQGAMNFKRRADRWFEMHLPEATPDIRDPNYMEWLKHLTIPVYMIELYDYAPTCVRYPIEEAIKLAGRDYFMSTVAFMCAIAEMEDFEEIHLYGINLAIGDEYFYEKPNAEWWLGRLAAQGRKIVIPRASSLLKQYKRYGYEVDARPNQSLKVLIQARIAEYKGKIEKSAAEANMYMGAMREDEALLQIFEGIDAGADVVLVPQTPAPPTAQAAT